jgi:ketosteroid isomerase-like protein
MANQAQQASAVLDHHLKAFGVGLDELMKDYTDASTIIGPEGPIRGTAAIRKMFQGLLGALPADFIPKLAITRREVHGDVAYIAWNVPPYCPLGTDTFVVRNGKIAVQTFAFYIPPAK